MRLFINVMVAGGVLSMQPIIYAYTSLISP